MNSEFHAISDCDLELILQFFDALFVAIAVQIAVCEAQDPVAIDRIYELVYTRNLMLIKHFIPKWCHPTIFFCTTLR